jgi:transcriptional regulator with XRE-family HTH domain
VALADLAGITQSTLSNYENGKREPAVSTLIRIAEELDVSLDELAGHTAGQNARTS